MSQPKRLNRRQVLQTASVLGIGATACALSNAASAASLPFTEGSGLITGQLKPLKYSEIPGLLPKNRSRHTITHITEVH